MNEKKKLIVLAAVGVLFAVGLGVMIFLQQEEIDASRKKADDLRQRIADGSSLIKKTRGLEEQVIIHRETDSAIQQILPNEAEITAFAITLEGFRKDSGIETTSIKRKRAASSKKGGKADFQEEGYTLNFNADAFQLLSFLSAVESHSRFMSVPSFKITAAKQKAGNFEINSAHQVTLDVVTYVYQPKKATDLVDIDSYGRKRDLLVAEIASAKQALAIPVYEYRGVRNRRDPWIDPRIPVNPEPGAGLSVEEQVTIVDDLVERTREVTELRDLVLEADNLIARMKAQKRFQDEFHPLEDETRRVEEGGRLTYRQARKRFEDDVVGVLAKLEEPLGEETDTGPTLDALRVTHDEMRANILSGEFDLAISAYEAIENELAESMDPTRLAMVEQLHYLRELAVAALAFERMPLDIKGVIVDEDQGLAVATINGRSVEVGEMLDNGLIIRAIQSDEIEFLYQGISLTRVIGEH